MPQLNNKCIKYYEKYYNEVITVQMLCIALLKVNKLNLFFITLYFIIKPYVI